uniref:Saposin B-type domain-containing protein n=1 Tax=Steinernema glaseri TaxID=37863 RepID=A0A1I8AVV6_9BILA
MKLLALLIVASCIAGSIQDGIFCDICLRLMTEVEEVAERFTPGVVLKEKAKESCQKMSEEYPSLESMIEGHCNMIFEVKFDNFAIEIRNHVEPIVICSKIRLC